MVLPSHAPGTEGCLHRALRHQGDPRWYLPRASRTRQAFRLHDKAQADADGYIRKQCPAVGPHATVSCPLRQMHPKTDGKSLVRITKQQTPREPVQVCEQKSITIPPTAGAKHRQEYAYKSEEWRAWYRPPRQSVESNNKSLKNGAHNPLDDSERRLARGWAALLLVATAPDRRRERPESHLMAEGEGGRDLPGRAQPRPTPPRSSAQFFRRGGPGASQCAAQ